ncbi:MAG: hypothetical protein PHD55_10745 [Methanoregula sp.]|nr:hypothetical protein [Methanoregula sp.]
MNTINPLNRNGIFLILAALLVISAGCIADQPQANATPARPAADTSSSQTPGTVTSTFQATITPTITATPSPAANIASFSDHGSVNVLRGKPFTITGTAPDKTMTTVQIWLLNRSVTTMLVPVQPDGTFSVTLDAGTTAALSRNFSSAIIAQYPAPPDRFAVNYDPASGQITASSAVPDRVLTGVNDKQYYPTTQQDYLCQAIDSPGTNNSCSVTFLNGVDAWIGIAPIPPGPPGTMTVSGTTSLPAGTPLGIDVATVNTHPTPKNYDFSHEYADGSAVVTAGTGGTNRYTGTVDTSPLNTGRYFVSVSTGDENLQANAHTYADVISPAATQACTKNEINWSELGLPALQVNESLQPVLLAGELKIVPPGTSAGNNEVPYGSIIDCGAGGICRVFDSSGVQFLTAYDSNEMHLMEVPNGGMIGSASGGNATVISLNGTVVLTKINECTSGN